MQKLATMTFCKFFMALSLFGLCILCQACVGRSSGDACLFSLDVCVVRHIAFQHMCHAVGTKDFQWEENRTAAFFPRDSCPLRTIKSGHIVLKVC